MHFLVFRIMILKIRDAAKILGIFVHFFHSVSTLYTLCSSAWTSTVYPKKYAHGFCFAVLCCGYALTDFPISIRLTSPALWQSNDCPSASKATLINMDKYFMWIHNEWLHNHNKTKHNKTVCILLGIYCSSDPEETSLDNSSHKGNILFPGWSFLNIIWPPKCQRYNDAERKDFLNWFRKFLTSYLLDFYENNKVLLLE